MKSRTSKLLFWLIPGLCLLAAVLGVRLALDAERRNSDALYLAAIAGDYQYVANWKAQRSWWLKPFKTSALTEARAKVALFREALYRDDGDQIMRLIKDDPGLVQTTTFVGSAGSPLHLAVMEHRQRACAALVAAGANVEAKDMGGSTPLHWAVMKNNLSCVQILLNGNAKVDARDIGGNTPLYYAYTPVFPVVESTSLEIAALLRKAGADPLTMTTNAARLEILKGVTPSGEDPSRKPQVPSAAPR